MKTNAKLFILAILCLIFSSSIFSSPLSPLDANTLFAHMVEVNKEWKSRSIDRTTFQELIYFENDQARIKKHLELVEQILSEKKVDHLSSVQQNNRRHNLQVLRQYWQDACFPINTKHSQRQPYFVDDFGTRCAVGYLVDQSGATDLVKQIAEENNFAYLREMQYPELKKWAETNGFSLEELAWIQPGYPPNKQYWQGVGNGGGVNGITYAMLTSNDGGMLYLAGNFSEVDGVAANNIIAWDGENWHTLGEGLDGVVNVLANGMDNNKHILVAGQFSINGQETHVAYWDTEEREWHTLQSGPMGGDVFAITYFDDKVYIGGDFQEVDGKALNNIAYLENGEWSNAGGPNQTIEAAFEIDEWGWVRAFEIVEDKLLIGGRFKNTAPAVVDTSIQQLEVDNLAFWDGENWEGILPGNCTEVYSLKEHEGYIWIGGEAGGNSVCFYDNEKWTSVHSFYQFGDEIIHGFLYVDPYFLTYGGFHFERIIGNWGYGLVDLSYFYNAGAFDGFATADGTIFAAENFKDHLYLAGDFSNIKHSYSGEDDHNGLVYSTFDPVNNVKKEEEIKKMNIVQTGDAIHFYGLDVERGAVLNIFNLQGQLLYQNNISTGEEVMVSTSNWANGTYVYQISNDGFQEAGKLAVFGF